MKKPFRPASSSNMRQHQVRKHESFSPKPPSYDPSELDGELIDSYRVEDGMLEFEHPHPPLNRGRTRSFSPDNSDIFSSNFIGGSKNRLRSLSVASSSSSPKHEDDYSPRDSSYSDAYNKENRNQNQEASFSSIDSSLPDTIGKFLPPQRGLRSRGSTCESVISVQNLDELSFSVGRSKSHHSPRGKVIRRNTDVAVPAHFIASPPPLSRSNSQATNFLSTPRRSMNTFVYGGMRDDQEEFVVPQPRSPSQLMQRTMSFNEQGKVRSPRHGTHITTGQFAWSKGKKIGKGTYGEVFVALDTNTGEQLAVKRINKGISGDGTQLAAFEQELRIMQQLKHPYIVQFICSNCDPEKGVLDIFLEYVAGGSLSHLIKEHGKLTTKLAAKFTAQMVLGIKYLHDKQIIHRDIKGGNVLIATNGVAKLADFGCSKSLDLLTSQERESTLQTMRGSVPWMAPEMIKGNYSYPADIWSIGATLIEMVSGCNPWPEQKELPSALFTIGSTSLPPPVPQETRNNTVLYEFILECCAVDPIERATPEQLVNHRFIDSVIELL